MYHNTREYFGMQDKNKYVRIVKITATGQSTYTHTHLKVSTLGAAMGGSECANRKTRVKL